MTLARRRPDSIARSKALVSRQLSRQLPSYLRPEEAHKLIDASGNERDRLFLRLLWETGVRVSEAIRIKLQDVGREGIRVLGKGNVERVVFVQEGLLSAILFHAQENGMSRENYMFSSRRGGHISKQRAHQIGPIPILPLQYRTPTPAHSLNFPNGQERKMKEQGRGYVQLSGGCTVCQEGNTEKTRSSKPL